MALIDSIVGYWKLNGNVVDETGTTADGSVSGATQVAGIIDDAYSFDGINDYGDIVYNPVASGDFQGAFSFSMWIKTSTTSNDRCLWGQYQSDTNFFMVLLNFGGVADRTAIFMAGTGGSDIVYMGASTINDGNWHLLTFTKPTGADATGWKLYFDGSAQSVTVSGNACTTYVSSVAPFLGARRRSGTSIDIPMAVVIDELGIWTKELSSTEVTELYNSGAGFTYPFTAAGLNMQVNIGDSWKSVAAAKINIGDSWKDVAAVKINIGDSWKSV